MVFKEIVLANTNNATIPSDIDIVMPPAESLSEVDSSSLHSLAFIPWADRYMSYVPEDYRQFYQAILPKLGARTTDVHTALSVSFVDELIALSGHKVDKKILTIAVLLHDIGWAQLTPAQIAMSLNYSAFAYPDEALEPKRLHASLGSEIAQLVLDEHQSALGLSDDDKSYLVKLVRHHDQINPWPDTPEPMEYLLLGDADRLWSYTHENFWLDTIRKNTDPIQYLLNITEVIDEHFLTPAGKTIARRLIAERAEEVAQLREQPSAGQVEFANELI